MYMFMSLIVANFAFCSDTRKFSKEMLNAVSTMIVLPTLPFYTLDLGGDAIAISTMPG